ncbi:MFS transporter [Nonomuraea sp. NPDC050786]|uniref:MFS transporter n=1 Tax=Nonomuraea sp. NPDC050786 TaxID=3154840 RepID=UPI0033D5C54A
MTSTPTTLTADSIGARLDRLRWSGTHLSILLALGAGWLFDSLEVNLVGSVINPLSEHFRATPEQSSRIFWVWLLGILFGAMAGGFFADKFGRRRLFLFTLLWYCTFTVLTALSPSLELLYALRFLTALGVGAEYAIINAAIMEFMPARVRGKSAAAVMNCWSLGAIASGLIAFLLLNTFALASAVSWRYGFALGGVLALLVLVFRRRLPESPRWLASQGRMEEAEEIVRRLTERAGIDPQASNSVDDHEPRAPGFGQAIRELIRRYPGRLALGCALDLSEAFGYYGIFALMSIVVLKQVHYTDAEIPFVFILGSIGSLIGGVCMTMMFDRLGRRWSVGLFYALAAASIGGLAAATSTGDRQWVLIAFMIANAVSTGAWTAAYPTFTELFPTHLRAAGIGTSVAVGRIGAAYGALYLPTLAAQIGATASYILIMAFWSFGSIAMIVWSVGGGVDGARKPLSALSTL